MTYGLWLWAVVLSMLMAMMAVGVRAGYGAMVGLATAGNSVVIDQNDWEAAARRRGCHKSESMLCGKPRTRRFVELPKTHKP